MAYAQRLASGWARKMHHATKISRRIPASRDKTSIEGPPDRGRDALMDPSQRVSREKLLRQAVLGGDEEAWRALYDDAFEPLRAYVAWRCAGLGDWTDEIVQQTWLTAVRRIGRFDPERGSFAAWLRGIAVNTLRNDIRRRQRERRRREPLDDNQPAAASIEQSIDQHEAAQRVAAALAALPQRYEQVLMAKYVERQSVAQIAGERDQSPKAIESQLARARKALREALGWFYRTVHKQIEVEQ